MNDRLIAVVVDAEVSDLRHPFTYRVPEPLPVPPVGSAVVVPFGGQTLLGFVVGGGVVGSLGRWEGQSEVGEEVGSPLPSTSPSSSNELVPLTQRHNDPTIPSPNDPTTQRPDTLKEIVDVLEAEPFFDERQWELARWMAERYHCTPRDSLRCIVPEAITAQVKRGFQLRPNVELSVLPPGQRAVAERLRELGGHATPSALRTERTPQPLALLKKLKERGVVEERYVLKPPKMKPKLRKAWRLAGSWRGDFAGLSAKQATVVASLVNATEPVLQTDLQQRLGLTPAVFTALEKKGLLVSEEVAIGRDPFTSGNRQQATGKSEGLKQPVTLNMEQKRALNAITKALKVPGGERFLLHGVTASGKTEVYLHALEACAASGRQGLLLVPEISLTAQMMDTVRSRFGARVAVLHSALSDGERYDEWMRIQRGEAAVVVGARSAVFAPLKKIGLVILDEEHETSYKQESTPRYHTRDVAARRAQLDGGVLVLGSATPSVETYYWAEQEILKLLEMPTRIDNRPLPEVRIIDLRAPEGTPQIFSEELAERMEERLRNREQAILFLNRRGYATFVLCRDCGYTAMCPNCSVTLTYHHEQRLLQCHHCDHRRRAPTKCPKCESERIRHFGLGTEKLEEECRRLFPDARLLRMDRDTTSRKGSHHELLAAFRQGEADILIGTQMVAKGLDFPRVTLVGVIAADTALNLPDFRAAERSFGLIAQVAGRAGRGSLLGEVIVQTFNPEHYSLQAAAQHDYASFYAQEIEHRREGGLNYPPFSRLANLVISDPSRETAKERAGEIAEALKREIEREESKVTVLGPAAAPMERIKGKYRWHLVLKAPDLRTMNKVLRPAVEGLDRAVRQSMVIDVDPMNLM
ncbi:MAG: primosomal protein N' [Armatimonadetes bacterium]|nr:primosomal protein N' [Armatimonadota bacterium]